MKKSSEKRLFGLKWHFFERHHILGGNFGVFEKCDFVPVCVCVFVYSKKDKILVFFSLKLQRC